MNRTFGRCGVKLSCIIVMLFLTACSNGPETKEYTIMDAPSEIAERAFRFAELYGQSETAYKWGGQDPVRAAEIDCSGLVIMCYKYALVDTKYQLLQEDMNSNYMYQNACTIIPQEELKKGDLIFIGEPESSQVTHIALFERQEEGKIHFIDSTQKDLDGDGIHDVNGVSRREYREHDTRLKAFGIMKLKY